MGREVGRTEFTLSERTHYRQLLGANLDLFEAFLDRGEFGDEQTIGLELELNLVDADERPATTSPAVLDELDDPDWVHEVGAWNVETNLPVTSPEGRGLAGLEDEIAARLREGERAAARHGSHVVAIGHLPTLTSEFLTEPGWRSPGARFEALDSSLMAARGERIALSIEGRDERLEAGFDHIAPVAACTSMQLHLQVAPERFASTWNAAQAIAGPQVALGANSPFLLGRALWHETRIATFEQGADSRPPEYAAQGIRPRVWFGERWCTSMFDLFEENVRLFPAIIPESREMVEEPLLTPGQVPRLHELMLHNGTVWRWNRPIFEPGGERPHLRLENRVLAAGPTPVDMVANAAFFYGIVASLVDERRPLWSRMAFEQAEATFRACARDGLDAVVEWPRLGRVPVAQVLADQLVPAALEGLAGLGADADVVERVGEVLRGRVSTRRTGARWQLDQVAALERGGLSRDDALVAMTARYRELMWAGSPVHEWAVG